MVVKSEAILTQLIYDHALRIRMKADASGTVEDAAPALPLGVVDGSGGPSGDTGAEPLTQIEPTLSSESQTPEEKPSSINIVGRLNNLVTTDIQTITSGRDWLLPGLIQPLRRRQLILTAFCSPVHPAASDPEHHFPLLDFGMECIRWPGSASCHVSCAGIPCEQAFKHASWENEGCECDQIHRNLRHVTDSTSG